MKQIQLAHSKKICNGLSRVFYSSKENRTKCSGSNLVPFGEYEVEGTKNYYKVVIFFPAQYGIMASQRDG